MRAIATSATELLRSLDFDQTEIFLGGEAGFGGFVEGGRGDYFEEELVHLFGGFGVDGTVYADHAAERGDGIAFERALVGFGKSLAGCGAYRLSA